MNMKKLISILSFAVLLAFISCDPKEKEIIEVSGLSSSVKDVSITKTRRNSLFSPLLVTFTKPIGKELKDKENNETIKIEIDSVRLYLSSEAENAKFLNGDIEIVSDSAILFNPEEKFQLDETYHLDVYLAWYHKVDNLWVRLKDRGVDYYKVVGVDYNPTVVDGTDVVFSTKRNGENNVEIVPYDGDMKVKLNVPVVWDINTIPSANADIALYFREIKYSVNTSQDYTNWVLKIDSTKNEFHYTPNIPLPYHHLVPNVYYTINLQFNYIYKNGDKWDFVMDSKGDTSLWNYNKSYRTMELFTPGKIISSVAPELGKTKVYIDTIPTIVNAFTNRSVIKYNDILFRPVFDEFRIIDVNKNLIPSKSIWPAKGSSALATKDSIIIKAIPEGKYFVPERNYRAIGLAHWEYKVDSVWHQMRQGTNPDTLVREWNVVRFRPSITKPSNIIKSLSPSGENNSFTPEIKVNVLIDSSATLNVSKFKFSPRYEFIKLTQADGITIVSDSVVKSREKSLDIKMKKYLIPGQKYMIKTKVIWQYLNKDNSWTDLSKDGGAIYETLDQEFSVLEVPGKIVKLVTPSRTKNSLKSVPVIEFGYKNNEVISKNGFEFKAVIDSVNFSNSNDTTKSTVKNVTQTWSSDGYQVTFGYDGMLKPLHYHYVYYKTHWEYKENGKFTPVVIGGSQKYEELTKSFGTDGGPGVIVSSITPSGQGIKTDSIIIVNFEYPIGTEIEYAGTYFKPVIISRVLKADNNIIDVSEQISTDKLSMIVTPSLLEMDKDYVYEFKCVWEYKNEFNEWVKVSNGQLTGNHEEVYSNNFSTIKSNSEEE